MRLIKRPLLGPSCEFMQPLGVKPVLFYLAKLSESSRIARCGPMPAHRKACKINQQTGNDCTKQSLPISLFSLKVKFKILRQTIL